MYEKMYKEECDKTLELCGKIGTMRSMIKGLVDLCERGQVQPIEFKVIKKMLKEDGEI